jgi:hypothetical protein
VVVRIFFLATLAGACATAADKWTEYTTGPFHVFSNAGDRASRDRLTEMAQIRWVLGSRLGGADLQTVWPIELILFEKTREYGPYALPGPFVEGGSAMLSSASAETPAPLDWRHELARMLIRDNAGRMPEPTETALGDLFSTIHVEATKVTLGTPPPAGTLSGDRLRNWAKLHLLVTSEEFGGRVRVYLNNLQQGGEESTAVRNAFGIQLAELDKRVDAYVAAGKFEGVPVFGAPINPRRDFVERLVPASAMDPRLEELKAQGKAFPPDSPRSLLAKGTRPALELAAKANPKWAEPHVKLAELETAALGKVREWKAATALAPRNPAYWQALAEAQAAADQFADASKSWAAAERAASSEAERQKIRQAKTDLENRRTEFELAEKKRLADERAADLQRVKDLAAAEVHAAEQAANRAQGGLKSDQKPIAYKEAFVGDSIGGMLTNVECIGISMRLKIEKDGGGTVALLVRNARDMSIDGQPPFACGEQNPARRVQLGYEARTDAKLGTMGDVSTIELR